MKLSTALQGFRYHLHSNGKSVNTISLYLTYLTKMSIFLEDPELESITSNDIIRYYAFMRHDYIPFRLSGDSRPLADGTIQNIWIAIRSFYNWVEKELKLPRADSSIEKPRFDYPEISPFSREEIQLMIKASESKRTSAPRNRQAFTTKRPTRRRDQAIIMLLLDTGIRVSECARLLVSDVNFNKSEIFIQPFGSARKTKSRYIPIGNTSKKFLWTYFSSRPKPSPHDNFFVTHHGSPMDRDSIRHVLDEIGDHAGVSNVHPHRFRHTFAIEYLRNGGDVFSLQKILGHTTLDMVNVYLQLAQSDIVAAHHRASPADNMKF